MLDNRSAKHHRGVEGGGFFFFVEALEGGFMVGRGLMKKVVRNVKGLAPQIKSNPAIKDSGRSGSTHSHSHSSPPHHGCAEDRKQCE